MLRQKREKLLLFLFSMDGPKCTTRHQEITTTSMMTGERSGKNRNNYVRMKTVMVKM